MFYLVINNVFNDAGGERLLVEPGHFTEGTAKRAFSNDKSQFYQTLYAILMLSEAFHKMYMEALASHPDVDIEAIMGDLQDVS